MTKDAYEGFAESYELFFSGTGQYDTVVEGFFRRLIDENGIHSVLDCACGTGHDLILFHSLGCEVSGTDISESMLAQARKNTTEAGLEVPLKIADYRELPQHFECEFDMVTCLSTAIAEVPDEAEALAAFRSMHRVLREGGTLVLTQGTTDRQWQEKPKFIPAINATDFTRLFVIDYFERGARYNVLDIYHSDKSHDFKYWSIDCPCILLRDDQERLLKEAGFSTVDFYGTYGFEGYDKGKSNRLITVARK